MTTRPALLFDLDGTLVDTIELIMQSMEFAFAEYQGAPPTREIWLEGLGITLRRQLANYARTETELDWLLARYRLYQGQFHDSMTAPYPGIPETLAELHARGHRMAIVTSKFHALANRVLRHVKFTQYFDVVIGGDSIENPKPHPQPVLTAIGQLGVPPEQAIFIGDSPHDVRAGNAAGVTTAAVLWGPFSRDQLVPASPTLWLEDVPSLRGIAGA